jgi:hypothetical protein
LSEVAVVHLTARTLRSVCQIVLIAGIGLAGASSAQAATVTSSYVFTAQSLSGPTPHHEGSFSVAWDTEAEVLTLTSISFGIADLVFDTATAGAGGFPATDLLVVGGNTSAVGSVVAGTTDFFLLFIDAGAFDLAGLPSSPSDGVFAYSQVGFPLIGNAYMGDTAEPMTLRLTGRTVEGAVPEPSTWALMIGGFGLAGASLRRRRSLVLQACDRFSML